MITEILLLADPILTPELIKALRHANPAIMVTPIATKADLEKRCKMSLKGARLISVGTDIIVPPSVLQALDGPAYNFHPGPPEFPGRYPSCFCLYHGGTSFGTTVHEMFEKVDAGPIVAIDRFTVPNGADRARLDALSFQSLFALFCRLAPHLTRIEAPLPPTADNWSGYVWKQKDFDELCHLPNPIEEDEFQRRYRAVGEGPDHALFFEIFGHRFCLDNGQGGRKVLIGGRPRQEKP